MKHRLFIAFWLVVLVVGIRVHSQETTAAHSPKEIVEQLWSMAVSGEMLSSLGWNKASRLYTQPGPEPNTGAVYVVANYYGVDRGVITGNTAKLIVWSEDIGTIDGNLRFSPAPPSNSSKTPYVYELVFSSTPMKVFDSDGKTVLKEIAGASDWRIAGALQQKWVSVNTAIRYVLEKRARRKIPQFDKMLIERYMICCVIRSWIRRLWLALKSTGPIVGKIEAAAALDFNKEQQCSASRSQRVQYQSLKNLKFQQTPI